MSQDKTIQERAKEKYPVLIESITVHKTGEKIEYDYNEDLREAYIAGATDAGTMKWRDANDIPKKSGMYITMLKIVDDGQDYFPVAYNHFDINLGYWFKPRCCQEEGIVLKWLDAERLFTEDDVKNIINMVCDQFNAGFAGREEFVSKTIEHYLTQKESNK